jgi:hypothetical protein
MAKSRNNEYKRFREVNHTIIQMTQKELRSYSLNSSEEPTDEMLHAIMLGVQETARRSTIKAEQELNRGFAEAKRQIAEYRATQNGLNA